MTDATNTTPLSPATEAYIWGFPLMSVHRTRLLLCSRTDTATMNHVNNLATPDDRAIVAPNNDTLYSSAWYDLRHGDLIINVPPMDHPQRYWNVMISDGYTHVTYVCRRHHGVAGTQVRVTYDPTTPPRNDNSSVVTVGTPTAWVIIRVLVESLEDIDTARALQRAITVEAPAGHPRVRTERAGRATTIAQAGADFFSELQRYIEIDAPAAWHPKLSTEAQAIVSNPGSVDPEELSRGVAEGDKLVLGGNLSDAVKQNGWRTGRAATDSGADILKRAVGAKFGLGGHQAIENRSYIAQGDSANQPLDGNRPLSLRFAADNMPPCSAFWSLTAYGTDLYLVANEIDRWSISDRTPGLHYAKDGSLTITLSNKRPADDANWLPVPAGPYMLGLRVYEGDAAVVNCSWFPPPLQPLG